MVEYICLGLPQKILTEQENVTPVGNCILPQHLKNVVIHQKQLKVITVIRISVKLCECLVPECHNINCARVTDMRILSQSREHVVYMKDS